jgi:hypothetical protein
MNLQTTKRALALTSALCALLGAGPATLPAATASPAHKVAPGAKKAPARAAQSVRIVIDGDYQPATVRVRAGVPTTLTFVLKSA